MGSHWKSTIQSFVSNTALVLSVNERQSLERFFTSTMNMADMFEDCYVVTVTQGLSEGLKATISHKGLQITCLAVQQSEPWGDVWSLQVDPRESDNLGRG